MATEGTGAVETFITTALELADGLPQLQRMVVSPAPRTCSSWGKVESSRDESVFEFLARPEVDLRGDTGKWLDLTF